ncbi:hypothetical protein SELMODRAFT_228472 [Selaginella moellendorffii]|uniref:START domain-containing protein n=1 Tax=Selaginella moellendorffii TaxID=88036 RepID=D8S225_SELML|nr:uncharacterized protein LOC9639212 [Selaginella moellendorffii]EFJ21392.1 hypothetical protein SELMODRAFT_228472 [Selaginella moellendorffii]|eukprot:XP_002977388.1 uncharacterized protein LOC9639212 [Selaginella moellendorffii]
MEELDSKGNFSVLGKPVVLETMADLLAAMMPIWVAIAFGIVLGWSWKPRWASFLVFGLRSRTRLLWSTPPGLGARRLWLAITAVTACSMLKELWLKFSAWRWPRTDFSGKETQSSSSPGDQQQANCAVSDEDLRKFLLLLEERDGGPAWQMMMDRSTTGMAYQAWRRDPSNGPTQYKSRTVIEGITPQLMRDFFWDDEFRVEWDDMLLSAKTLDECPETGYMLVHWVRKFPFFCKDREYTIGRRIWEHGNTYYCLQMGVETDKVPRKNKPRRVDVFYSSFRIRAVESRKGDSQLTACEVLLFHSEEMGIQKDLAKLGVRQGMWGCVKGMEPGAHSYLASRKSAKPLSRPALMAQITTKVPASVFRELGIADTTLEVQAGSGSAVEEVSAENKKNVWRWIILGGAVALACGVDRGAVGKVLLFGIARRLGRLGRKL